MQKKLLNPDKHKKEKNYNDWLTFSTMGQIVNKYIGHILWQGHEILIKQ